MTRRLGLVEWLIIVSSAVFVVVLAVSAWWERDIRWLHFFQAWMYVATAVLAIRRNKWGYFIGIAAGGLWAYTNLFVTNFLMSGLRELRHWISSGTLSRPDQLIAVAAWSSNVALVVACLVAYGRRGDRAWRDWLAFLVTFVVTTEFFAGAMALFQPRYLALFPRMLHPHLP